MALSAQRLARSWEKNREDLRAIARRTMPRFVRNRPVRSLGREVPVFVFHSVRTDVFERQLAYLADNGYETIAADELARSIAEPPRPGHRKVALTFDDATGSFWAVASPLLRKYGFRGIVFAVAGLVPDEEQARPNLEDVWAGRAAPAEIERREAEQPLCTWRELNWMQGQGHVDVQSHSLSHARVPLGPQIVDFVHPAFDPYLFGNVNVPLSPSDPAERPVRALRLGAPLHRSAPLLAGRPRYRENPDVADRLVEHVAAAGGAAFFARRGWREELGRRHAELVGQLGAGPGLDSVEATRRSVRDELTLSRRILETRLSGAPVEHFCYPWFTGSSLADTLAADCGYRSVFYGLVDRHDASGGPAPMRVRRVSEEYLQCLPGRGRRWPWRVWLRKLRGTGGRRG